MEFNEPKGIYLQIADQICVRIIEGEWGVGERIPSIRELAVELGVNPNTVTKSYQALLDKMVISNQRGRGYFVSEGSAEKVLTDMKEDFLKNELPDFITRLELLGIEFDELVTYLPLQKKRSKA